jgi:hypothetical protein
MVPTGTEFSMTLGFDDDDELPELPDVNAVFQSGDPADEQPPEDLPAPEKATPTPEPVAMPPVPPPVIEQPVQPPASTPQPAPPEVPPVAEPNDARVPSPETPPGVHGVNVPELPAQPASLAPNVAGKSPLWRAKASHVAGQVSKLSKLTKQPDHHVLLKSIGLKSHLLEEYDEKELTQLVKEVEKAIKDADKPKGADSSHYFSSSDPIDMEIPF